MDGWPSRPKVIAGPWAVPPGSDKGQPGERRAAGSAGLGPTQRRAAAPGPSTPRAGPTLPALPSDFSATSETKGREQERDISWRPPSARISALIDRDGDSVLHGPPRGGRSHRSRGGGGDEAPWRLPSQPPTFLKVEA